MWKKYHRVSRPAFNERNHELVWNETFKIVNRLFEEDALWKDKECVECDQVLEVTLGVSVMVINFKSTINDLSRLLWKFWERQVGLPIKINISLANLLHWQRLASRMEPQPKSWKDMRCRLLRHSRLYLQIRSNSPTHGRKHSQRLEQNPWIAHQSHAITGDERKLTPLCSGIWTCHCIPVIA
jgi:hypothetical protein